MSIVGEVLQKYVTDQLKLRQEKLGESTRSSTSLAQINTNTAWIKLTSAIDIKDTEKFGGFDGDIGSRFSLFGGSALDGNILGGFSAYDQTLFGYEQGYRPAPGIISFDTKNKNRGSLRESTVKLQAYSRRQFQLIDTLFLRLGFSVLIEFGNSLYYDSTGTLVQAGATNSIASDFVGTKYNGKQDLLLQDIEKKREETAGNYDGIFGRISNFSWSFTPEGVYEISLTIMSYGDIIENLKANSTPTEETGEGKTDDQKEKEEEVQEDLDDAESDEDVIDILKDVDVFGRLAYAATNLEGTQAGEQFTISPMGDLLEGYTDGGESKKYDILQAKNEGDGEKYYYIRFGAFLQYLWKNQMLYVDQEGTKALISIENFLKQPAYIFRSPYTISSNPKLCLIKTGIRVRQGTLGEQTIQILESLPEEARFESADRADAGNLLNVYFNLAALSRFSYELRDSKNKVSYYDLLDKMLKTVESTLGGRNTLVIDIDEQLNFNIIDEHPIPTVQAEELAKADYKLQLFGVKTGNNRTGTTVRSFGIETAITNELASTITIGAQANGRVKGEDATAFSKWNQGLSDRILPIKTNQYKQTEEQRKKEQEQQASIAEENENIAKEYSTFIDGQYKFDWPAGEVETFPNILTEYINFDETTSAVAQDKATGGLGFLPLNLKFTLDGIAGLKIYQGIVVDSTFLPPNYGDTMQFIITGISHKIEGNRWLTDIETNMVPSQTSTSPGDQTLPSPAVSNTGAAAGSASATSNTPVTFPSGTGPVRLRVRRKKEDFSPGAAKPSGTGQTLGVMELLDENGRVVKQFTTVELPWRGNQNSISCIPPGTYTFSKSKANNNPGLGDVLRLSGIPYRSGVLVHIGTNHKHTHGCILPGIPQQVDRNGDAVPDNKAGSTQQAMNQIINALYPSGVSPSTTYSIQVVGIPGKEYKDSRASGEVYQNPNTAVTSNAEAIKASREIYIQLAKELEKISKLEDTLYLGKPLLENPASGFGEDEDEIIRRYKQIFNIIKGSILVETGRVVPWQNTYGKAYNSMIKNHKKLFKYELELYFKAIRDDDNTFLFPYPSTDGEYKKSTQGVTLVADGF